MIETKPNKAIGYSCLNMTIVLRKRYIIQLYSKQQLCNLLKCTFIIKGVADGQIRVGASIK